MAHPDIEPDLDDLYRQIMGGFDSLNTGPAPDLQLPSIRSTAPTDPDPHGTARPVAQRKKTSDSDQLMDIYSAYDGPATHESDGPLARASPTFRGSQPSPNHVSSPLPTSPYPSSELSTRRAPHSQNGHGERTRSRPLPPVPPSNNNLSPSMYQTGPPLKRVPSDQYMNAQESQNLGVPPSITRHSTVGQTPRIRTARKLPIAPNVYRHTSYDQNSSGHAVPPADWSDTSPPSRKSSLVSDHTANAENALGPASGMKVAAQRAVSGGRRGDPRRAGVQPTPDYVSRNSSSDSSTTESQSRTYTQSTTESLTSSGTSYPGQRSPSITSSYFDPAGHPSKPQYVGYNSAHGSMGPYVASPTGIVTPDDDSQYLPTPPSSRDATSLSPNGSYTARASSIVSGDSYPVAGPSEWHAPIYQKERAPGRLGLHEDADYDFADDFTDPEELEEDYCNSALLSHVAVRLRDKVPRGTHVKESIPYPRAFTGKDVVSTIQSVIQRDLYDIVGDRRQTALQVARSLHSQLFFYEVEWGGNVLLDGVEDVYMFLDEPEGGDSYGGGSKLEREELPTGVITSLTRCYSPSCGETPDGCYSWSCPRRAQPLARTHSVGPAFPELEKERTWEEGMDPLALKALPQSEINRQNVIFKIISKEAQYVKDLDLIDHLFVKPLRSAPEPIIDPDELDSFIDLVFGNVLDLRETNRRLLEVMYVRQREQGPVIQWIGDIFLTAAAEFRVVYPLYVGNLPLAEKKVKDEAEHNPKFRMFLEQQARIPEARRLDLRHFITRPSEHLQKYPVLLEAIRAETAQGNPDSEYLLEASEAIRKLTTVAHLRTFQSSMGRGPVGKQEWHDLVPADIRETIPRKEQKRQAVIFELIKGEMEYVKDLELIHTLFIRPLRKADLNLADKTARGLDDFIKDIFWNYEDILAHHRRLLHAFHEIQRDEYPCITSVMAPLYDATLNWRDAYTEYVPHYPIAVYRVEEAMSNPQFKKITEDAQRHSDARRLDIKFFINRPIPRMLRYDLLLKAILSETPEDHEDKQTIPLVLEVIRDLGKTVDYSITTAERKVELWRFDRNLVWRPGEYVDMDLLDETRTLVHVGRLLRTPESSMEWSGWTELFVILFDNYLVITKPKEKDGVTRYHVNRRPIPLELLTLLSFTDTAQQRSTSLLRGFRGGGGGDRNQHNQHSDTASMMGDKAEATDSRLVYPCSIHHAGRVGGHYHLYAESAQIRSEWKRKLDEALGLRQAVQEANKVFEPTTISMETFVMPGLQASSLQSWNDGAMTGKVTCSVPLTSSDGRPLIAVGCNEGVWIGLRHDSQSMRRVLHLKQVTQCAMLVDFGIFLVLADKSLFAYHIEALVPTGPPSAASQRQPQKLNGSRDVQFFSVGTLYGRTLIIYMKKKGLDSVFRVLEPVTDKIAEKAKVPAFGRNLFGPKQSEWFRVYKEFFLPSESSDLIFLKSNIAILCTKGFEVMNLDDFKSVTIPQRDDPKHAGLAKRCESSKPMGMFRSNEDEFLLCYAEFGLYVDRHGDPNRSTGVIEWEGTAERVAFHPPYVLIFDSRFIEIRHIEKGKLVQIIPGTDMRCTWDGRGSFAPPPMTPGPGGWDERSSAGEPRIHAVMKAEQSPALPARAALQHVFELTPTVPIFQPPSLQSAPTGYFPTRRSSSPPYSPRPSSGGSGWTR